MLTKAYCPAASSSRNRRFWPSARIHAFRAGEVLFCVALLITSVAAQEIEPARTALINPRAIAINPATHRVYVVDQPENSVVTEDIRTERSISIPVGKSPVALAIDSGLNRIYVVNSASDTVSVIDGATQSVAATIPAGKMPYAIEIDPGLRRVLVMNTYSDFVTEIDETTNRAERLPLGPKDAVAVDSRLHRAYLLGYEDPALTVLDEMSRSVRRAPGVMHLWGLAIDEKRGILYATEAQSRALLALQETTGAETTISVGAMPLRSCRRSADRSRLRSELWG